jgi:CubicO group peptidase (beta-lactamase class C family)
VDAYLAPYLARHDFSGVVLVARGDSVLLSKGYGMASYELGVPNSARTAFRIASITKTFTAAAIVMLAERGALRYDDRVSRFLPDFPPGSRITIEQLLLHASGLRNPEYEELVRRRVPVDTLLRRIGARPLLFEPGTESRYSNAGYIVLAAVVERATGMPFGAWLREHVLAPLGMRETRPDEQDALIPGRAAGYLPGPGAAGVVNAPWYDMSAMFGSGSLLSSAADLHRWARAVHMERLFRRSALRYPYGWGTRTYFGREAIEQSGTLDGFTSYLAIYFRDSTYVVCLTNVEASLNEQCGKDVAAIAFGEPVAAAPVPAPVAADPLTLSAYVGAYESDVGRFQVTEEGGELYVRWATALARHHLMPTGRDRLHVRADRSTITFVRDAAGRVTHATRTWERFESRFRRVEVP